MASTQRSSWILFHFFVLFVVSYAVGVLFLHITVSLCKYKDSPAAPATQGPQDKAPAARSHNSAQENDNNINNNNNNMLNSSLPNFELSNDAVLLSQSHLLATSRARGVSRTLTLRLYLAAVAGSNNHSRRTSLSSELSIGHSQSGTSALLYSLQSDGKVSHLILYPNSTQDTFSF